MKFAALLISAFAASPSPLLGGVGGPNYCYYNANQLDAALNINVDVNLDADIALFKKVCTRGNYGGYDCYRCTQRLSPSLDICLNVNLNVGLGVNIGGIHL
jgi:hypothetical protein